MYIKNFIKKRDYAYPKTDLAKRRTTKKMTVSSPDASLRRFSLGFDVNLTGVLKMGIS
ncbi:hypothetical protein TRIP_E190267 [uncultured Spirochaetota bacterium]|nr:hypothetical protein TRIP_E190267 [uncultured Spirochaetota bacterium]